MNRYLYTVSPISLPGHYREIVAESCLLHTRNVGDFFFGKTYKDDITIDYYYSVLLSKEDFKLEIDKSKPKWKECKERINKKLSHLTFSRVNTAPMSMQEINDLRLDYLIELFKNNLPVEFHEKWNHGKSFSF